MLLLTLFILGLCLGSFINALVWRLYRHKPIGNDRSECPNCGHKLSAADLIPVFSWLWLRGRCRYCKKPISWQYPLVELLCALLFVISYLALQPTNTHEYLLFGIWLTELVILLALAVYDLRWMLLPNKLIVLAGATAIIGLIVGYDLAFAVSSLVAAVTAGSFFWFVHAISDGKWMGGGDVKLAFIMGLILGASKTLVALLVAFNLAALIGVILILSKKLSRKSLLPFGPFLITGTFVATLWGQRLIDWYLNLVGLY